LKDSPAHALDAERGVGHADDRLTKGLVEMVDYLFDLETRRSRKVVHLEAPTVRLHHPFDGLRRYRLLGREVHMCLTDLEDWRCRDRAAAVQVESREESPREIRRRAGANVGQSGAKHCLAVLVATPQRRVHANVRIITDDTQRVLLLKLREKELHGLNDETELLPSHGTGSVEHDGQSQWGAVFPWRRDEGENRRYSLRVRRDHFALDGAG